MRATRGLAMAVQAVERIKAKHPEIDVWMGHGKFGGHGDTAVAIAHARAGKRWAAAAFPGATVGTMVLARTTGSQTDLDIFRGTREFLGGYVVIPDPPWHDAVRVLRPHFDVYHDLQYVCGTYFSDPVKHAALAIEAEQRLRPFSRFYSGFPLSNNELGSMWPVSQWELMSRSGLVDVTPADLWVPVTEPTVAFDEWNTPTTGRSWRWAQQMRGRLDKCVAIHAGAGGNGNLKVPGGGVFEAIAAAALGRGLTPVQVGTENEPVVAGCVDARGLALAETAWVVQGAMCAVCAEGFMAYVARAVNTRALVFFGPTPTRMFGMFEELDAAGEVIFPGHVNHSCGACPACWWATGGGWDSQCPKVHAKCLNHPSAGEAEDLMLRFLLALEAQPWPPVAVPAVVIEPVATQAAERATAANVGDDTATTGKGEPDDDDTGSAGGDGSWAAELQQPQDGGEGGEGDPQPHARRDPLSYL